MATHRHLVVYGNNQEAFGWFGEYATLIEHEGYEVYNFMANPNDRSDSTAGLEELVSGIDEFDAIHLSETAQLTNDGITLELAAMSDFVRVVYVPELLPKEVNV
jgi:hypothetical protein